MVDSDRCRGVCPGDLLVAVNDVTVARWSHEDVVNVLRACRSRRVARLTLITPRRRRDTVRPTAGCTPARPSSAMASPVAEQPAARVDYNQLYRQLYTPLPFTRVAAPDSTHTIDVRNDLRCLFAARYFTFHEVFLLVYGQVTIIFILSVCLSVCLFVCLFVCLCRVFLSRLRSDLDQTRTHVICPGLVVSPTT